MLCKNNERGATMTEYAMVTAVVVVMATVGFARLGASEVDAMSTSGDALVNASGGMKNDDGSSKTFLQIMEEVGHPLAAAGHALPDSNQGQGKTK